MKTAEGISIKVDTFDLSQFGACIRVPKTPLFLGRMGIYVDLEFRMPDSVKVCYLAKIRWTEDYSYEQRIGVEFVEQTAPYVSHLPENTSKEMYELPDYFPLSGFYYKPYLFFERGLLRITSISAKFCRVLFYDPETILFKSQVLELWLLGFDRKAEPVKVEIRGLERNPEGQTIAECLIKGVPNGFEEWVAHQMIFICDLTPVAIRRLGFDTSRVSNGFRFRFAKTQEDYENVLKLRHKAYLEANKIDATKTHWDMAAPLDPQSRILICHHGDKVIGSVSISFPQSNSDTLDTERAFPNGYPTPIPDKTTIVEIARLCTDSDYRRTDLLNRMFEYTYKVTICGDRAHILTSTDAKLWPLYKKLGFKKTGMSYAHPYLSGLEHHIILGERAQPDYGSNISPLAWNYIWRDMNFYMEERGMISKSILQKTKIFLMALVGRMLRIQTDRHY